MSIHFTPLTHDDLVQLHVWLQRLHLLMRIELGA